VSAEALAQQFDEALEVFEGWLDYFSFKAAPNYLRACDLEEGISDFDSKVYQFGALLSQKSDN